MNSSHKIVYSLLMTDILYISHIVMMTEPLIGIFNQVKSPLLQYIYRRQFRNLVTYLGVDGSHIAE